jgi:hypothetical protein
VGPSEVSAGTIIWMVELVWKASFQHLEFSPSLFNVDSGVKETPELLKL